MAKYPDAIYEPREKENRSGVIYIPEKKSVIFVEDVKKLDDEIVAVETELGTNPKGSFADVKARLEAVYHMTGSLPFYVVKQTIDELGVFGYKIIPYGEITALNPEYWIVASRGTEENQFAILIHRGGGEVETLINYSPVSNQITTGKKINCAGLYSSGEVELLLSLLIHRSLTVAEQVTINNPPRARGYLNGNQLNFANGVFTRVNLNAETYDSGNIFNPATYRFTPGKAGYYLITGQVTWLAVGLIAAKKFCSAIYVNGAEKSRASLHTALVDRLSCPISDIIYLDDDDYVELWAQSNQGDNAADIAGESSGTFMCVHRLS